VRSLCLCHVVLTAIVAASAAPASTALGATGEVRAELRAARAPAAQLELSSLKPLAGGTVVRRFAQEVEGVEVADAGAVVLDAPGAPPRLIFDETRAAIEPPGAPTVGRRGAIRIARGAAGIEPAARPRARLMIRPGWGGTLVWEIGLVADRPLADLLVSVDARSGDVVATRDRLWRASGHAKLFDPNPVVTQGSYFGLRDRRDRDTKRLTHRRIRVTLRNLSDASPCLDGHWARARLGRRAKPVCKDSRNWKRVRRSENRFEALMAYFHVDRAQEYIQSLGLPEGINDEPQSVVANGISDDNSYYQPGRDQITLGAGGVDDGEDAEVIVHEYGHAVQDAQVEGFGSGTQAGAQGEGFGDYLAAAYTTERAPLAPLEFSHCVMEWDAVSYDTQSVFPPGICLRRVDQARSLSKQRELCRKQGQGANEIHCIGEVWASALWTLRTSLGDDGDGRKIMDRVVLASHELLPNASPSFEQASRALIESDSALYAGGPPGVGPHCEAIRDEMVSRELLTGNACAPE
jgi:Zn-dependent metalloprotease